MSRTGWGYDAHRLGGPGPLTLCGVEIVASGGLIGTSDGDVAVHAVIDAMLGAAALGDTGEHFPSSDPRWSGADSMDLLAATSDMIMHAGFEVSSVDVTIVAESVRIAPHRARMRSTLATALGISIDFVSVKATSTDGMGAIGRGEGIAATAVATLDHM